MLKQFIGLYTLVSKEVARFFRLWTQTLLPSAVTTTLYFVIFGNFLGKHIQTMNGFAYIDYIVPGLIMMAVINNSYVNISSSFFLAKFTHSIEELLVSPLPDYFLVLGYMISSMLRAFIVAIIVTLISLAFTNINIYSLGLMFLVVIASSLIFSSLGFINGLLANKFDDINMVPTFVLTPLTYLGGVFYSVSSLPPIWQKISLFNPVFYMVNAFRYSCLGKSAINVDFTLVLLITFAITSYLFAWYLLRTGYGVKK